MATVAAVSLLDVAPALAQETHVGNRCPRLSAVSYDELDARVLLLLKAEEGVPSLPVVVCSDQEAWLEWQDRRFDLPGRSIVEEVIDVIEAQRRDEREATPPAAEPSVTSTSEEPAVSTLRRKPARHGGGLAVALAGELPTGTVGTSLGPVVDFGKSVGPTLLGGRLAFRLSTGGRQVSFMDLAVALGFGAPFNTDERFGVVLGLGGEIMVATPTGGTARSAVAPMSYVGFRGGLSFGLVGVWLGVDGRVRLTELELRLERERVRTSRFGAAALLGVDIVDWSQD
jgi:hypothetical protein